MSKLCMRRVAIALIGIGLASPASAEGPPTVQGRPTQGTGYVPPGRSRPAPDSTPGPASALAGQPTLHLPSATEIGPIQLDPKVRNGVALILSVNGTGTIRQNEFSCTPHGQQTSRICQRTVTKDEAVTLIAVPPDGQSFVGWAGACTGTVTTCFFRIKGQTTVAATFMKTEQPAVERLTVVYKSDPSKTTVLEVAPKFAVVCPGRPRGSPAQITACIVDVPTGTALKLSAYLTSGMGAVVVLTESWHGDCEGTHGQFCNLIMDKPRTVNIGTF